MSYKIIKVMLLFSLGLLTNTYAQKVDQAKPNQELVGKQAKDFTLRNQKNKEVKLSSFRGKKNVVLVFSRAHW